MKKKARCGSGRAAVLEGARVPKLCGADVELGNFVLGLERQGGTSFEASRALLSEIEGLPVEPACECPTCRAQRGASRYLPGPLYDAGRGGNGGGAGFNAQDWGRKFLPSNGGCVYIDLDHLELCLPEVLSAHDHVAGWRAMLRIAGEALAAANRKQPSGRKIQVLVNNSDGKGNSYGSHLDFLLTRKAWDQIFLRRMHYLLYLAAYQVSSMIFTGQGKVGSENGRSPAAFQLSQRADFFETLSGTQTTFRRPIVNSRDEPLCGGGGASGAAESAAADDLARLHVIFFDSNLCQVASLLKVGVMQTVLAMLEAEHVNPNLILEDPLEAVVEWSHDPTLQARARMLSGKKLTALELQLLFLEEAKGFAASGGCDGIVPRAGAILALWEDTLGKLQARDLAALTPRLDWVLKLSILQGAIEQRRGLDWESPQIKYLDHLYSSLDPSEGLYWAYEERGLTERVVTEAQIAHFVDNPPEDTRAWTRAMLLRRAGRQAVDRVDWDSLRLKSRTRGFWPRYATVDLANPLAFTRAAMQDRFEQARTLDQLLEELSAPEANPSPGDASPGRGPGEAIALAPHGVASLGPSNLSSVSPSSESSLGNSSAGEQEDHDEVT